MGAHVWSDDFDLLRERVEDWRRDEPDETELLCAQADIAAVDEDRGAHPVGTRIAGKPAT